MVSGGGSFERDVLIELGYLAGGIDTLARSAETVSRNISAVSRGVDRLAEVTGDGLDQLAALAQETNKLLCHLVDSQHGILRAIQAPATTAAQELLARAATAADNGWWQEALQDYDSAIALNWNQPVAHLGRGMALLALAAGAEDPSGPLDDAGQSFSAAARYGERSAPNVAVRALLHAVAVHDHMGRCEQASKILEEAPARLPQSPEIAFAAGLRFQKPMLLDQAVSLDPTFAADRAWQELPFAQQVSAGLLERQRQTVTLAARCIHAASEYSIQPDPPAPPSECATGLKVLRDLQAAVQVARTALASPAAPEGDEHQSAHRARTRAATLEHDAKWKRQGDINSGWNVMGLWTSVAGAAIALWAWAGDSYRYEDALDFGIGLFILGLAIPLGRKIHKTVSAAELAQRAGQEKSSADVHDRNYERHLKARTDVLELLKDAEDQVRKLTSRSPEAYAK